MKYALGWVGILGITLSLLVSCTSMPDRAQHGDLSASLTPSIVPLLTIPQPLPTIRQPTASPPPHPTAAPTPPPQPTVTPTIIPQAIRDQSAALRSAYASTIAEFTAHPYYELQLWIEPSQQLLTGTLDVRVTNQFTQSLTEMVFRLYPNFPADVLGRGGDVRMEIDQAMVDDRIVPFDSIAQRTAVMLPLVPPRSWGQSIQIRLTFRATIRPQRDGTWALPSYYPIIAAFDEHGWRRDVTRFADHVFAASGWYHAQIVIPSSLTLLSTGSVVQRVDLPTERTIYTIVTGIVREFALSVGDLVSVSDTVDDITVHVAVSRGSRLDARSIATIAIQALDTFQQRFGAYPYRELDMHLLPYDYTGGDEYPGLIFLYTNSGMNEQLRFVAAHEVAHQWWYGIVGNDIYQEPWLDEALAQYSAIIYAEDAIGAKQAQADWQREIDQRYKSALQDGDMPVGLSIYNYPNFTVYYHTIYGKGPVFLRTLRQTIGDDAFFNGLRIYVERHRHAVASTTTLKRALEDASGIDLTALFEDWLGKS